MCLQQADMPTANDSRDSKLKVCRCFLLEKADSLQIDDESKVEELTARKQNIRETTAGATASCMFSPFCLHTHGKRVKRKATKQSHSPNRTTFHGQPSVIDMEQQSAALHCTAPLTIPPNGTRTSIGQRYSHCFHCDREC